jgi:outer membrane receptor protein involved in Fe transport
MPNMRKVNFLVSVAMLATAAPVWAQEQATPADDEASTDSGDIIVTATRREESLSNVPIAISALSGESLANTGASDIRAVAQIAPSLLVSGATSEVSFTARIRGVGTVGENPGLESSVGLFIDGVYRSRTGVGLSELGDIERVEVLRGPQGTLFGKNSTAGLINIVTKKPGFDFEAKGSATYGNYDYYRVDGSVTGGLTETIAARLDAVYQKRDGFTRNVTPGEKDSNDRDRYLIRGQVLFQPNSDISLRLTGDYSKRNEICCAAPYQQPLRNLSRDPQGNVVVSANTLLPVLNGLGANITVGTPFNRSVSTTPGFNYRSDSEDYGVSGELNWDLGGVKLTAITAYRDYENTQGQDTDFNRLDILRRTALTREFKLFTQEARLQGELFDGRIDWLIGGYYSSETLNVTDDSKFGVDSDRYFSALTGGGFSALTAAIGGTPLAGTGVIRNAFKQESDNYAFFTHNVIQIIPDKLSLTLGGRYTHERKDLTGSFNTNNTLCSAFRNIASPLAGFACAINNDAGPGFTKASPGTRRTENEFTGTAVLSYKPTEDLLVYGSFSRGFKAGGFNLDTSALDALCNPNVGGAAPSAAQAVANAACVTRLALPANTVGNARAEASDLQFAPERVNAYELGVKYNGRGFDINVAAFYQTYGQFQLNTFNGINFEVTNLEGCRDDLSGADRDASVLTGACAANRTRSGVKSKGFEIESVLRPVKDVSVNLGLTYSDTIYRNNLVGTNGRPLPPTLFQLPGRQISNAPKYVVTTGFGYTPEIGNSGLSGLLYVDARYQSDTNTGSDLDAEKVQDGFLVVNGRIGLFGPDKKWGVELFGQNLFNKKYQQIAADAPLQGSGTFGAVQSGIAATANQLFIAFPGEPRTYGITVRGKF